MFKLFKGLLPTPFIFFFCISSSANTRGHSAKLVKTRCQSDIRRFFFSDRIVDMWNSLYQDAIDSESGTVFASSNSPDRIRTIKIVFFQRPSGPPNLMAPSALIYSAGCGRTWYVTWYVVHNNHRKLVVASHALNQAFNVHESLSPTVDGREASSSDDSVAGRASCWRPHSAHQRSNRPITTMPASAAASQQTTKSGTEILRTERINERVDSGVAVAKPEEDDERDRWCAVGTENTEDVHGEERSPAQYETADDHSYSLGGFLLAVQTPQLGSDLDKASPGVCCVRRVN